MPLSKIKFFRGKIRRTSFTAAVAVAFCLFGAFECCQADTPLLAQDPAEDEPPPAGALLLGVVEQLPPDPIRIAGELLVRRRRGVPVATYQVELIARWGARNPQSSYTIRDAFGSVLEQLQIEHSETPSIQYAVGDPPVPASIQSLARPVQQSDISWMDLTLSFLWWTDARHEGSDSVRGFECYVIRVYPPEGLATPYRSVRLWIGRQAGMMMQAEGLDHNEKPVRRLWVRSVRKMEDSWMIKDMEFQHYPAVQRTRFHIDEVKRLQL